MKERKKERKRGIQEKNKETEKNERDKDKDRYAEKKVKERDKDRKRYKTLEEIDRAGQKRAEEKDRRTKSGCKASCSNEQFVSVFSWYVFHCLLRPFPILRPSCFLLSAFVFVFTHRLSSISYTFLICTNNVVQVFVLAALATHLLLQQIMLFKFSS